MSAETTTEVTHIFYNQDNMNVLVIGGAGYIGSHAALGLREHGHEVLIYDNLATGFRQLADGFELVVADIADTAALKKALSRADAIMHFAAHAYVGESVENPRKYFHNNVEGGLALLNAVIDSGVKPMVFSSTCAVYGIPSKVPITEDNVRNPINPYGISKHFFEQALESYDRAYGLQYASLRYFNAAGADEKGRSGELHEPETHLIPLALEAAAGTGPELRIFGDDYPTPDGTCIRDYIHVNDLAEAHVLAIEYLVAGKPSLQANLGTGRGFSIREVLHQVEAVTGRKVPYSVGPRRAGDPAALVADPTRAAQALGWRSKRDLHDIVATAWAWAQKTASLAPR